MHLFPSPASFAELLCSCSPSSAIDSGLLAKRSCCVSHRCRWHCYSTTHRTHSEASQRESLLCWLLAAVRIDKLRALRGSCAVLHLMLSGQGLLSKHTWNEEKKTNAVDEMERSSDRCCFILTQIKNTFNWRHERRTSWKTLWLAILCFFKFDMKIKSYKSSPSPSPSQQQQQKVSFLKTLNKTFEIPETLLQHVVSTV